MLSIAEARTRLLASLAPTGIEIVSLAEAAGRVTAAPVIARVDQPAHDVSAMDGYALRSDDGEAGAKLRVIGTAPAGHPFEGRVRPGEAVRLFTGSVVPLGADGIVLQEDARRDGDTVVVTQAARAGRHIRRRGGDFASGDVLIEAGTRLQARAIGLAASANHPWLSVRRRPTIALLATGDEVVLPGEPIGLGGVPSSNSFAIAALVEAAGGAALILPVASDDTDAIADAAASASRADMLVTLGGASVGDHDLVRPALARHGFAPDVWTIAMRPGKPLMHGQMHVGAHSVPVLGLPGNPVSSLVCGALFLQPAIARLLGQRAEGPIRRRVRLGTPLPPNDSRTDHLRATLGLDDSGEPVAFAMPVQDSSRLRDLTRADALIVREPNAPALAADQQVDVIMLAELGI